MIGATHNIKGRRGNGNIARCLAMHKQGNSARECARILGIHFRTAQSYIAMANPQYGAVSHDKTPRCRCHLRLSTPAELASGQCSGCLPTSAAAFLGRRDEPFCTVG